jgi:5-methylcytosine-specific restriction endonuclease McrA
VRRATRDAGGNRGNGGKWIRPEKRKRIYARDGWRCVWCYCKVEQVTRDSFPACLDHVLPREHGGSNHESNLVTSCFSCNAARGTRSAVEYAWTLANAYATLDRVITAMGTPLKRAA